MKHLKAFGKLFESIESLWEQITGSEWSKRESIWGKDVQISDSDKRIIREFVNSNWGTKKPEWVNWDFNFSFSDKVLEIEIKNNSINDRKLVLLIVKTGDDWYLAKEWFYRWHKGASRFSFRQVNYQDTKGNSVYESYYKCDTIDGVKELLKARREWLYNKN